MAHNERFTIFFSGHYETPIEELFPDKFVDMQSLLGEGQPSLDVFLNEWNYGDLLTITITDNLTGEVWVKPVGENSKWHQLHQP